MEFIFRNSDCEELWLKHVARKERGVDQSQGK